MEQSEPNCEFLGTSTDWIDRNPQKAKALGLIKNGKHIAPTTPEQRIAVWPSKFRHSNEELKWLYRNRNIQARKMIAPYAFCANGQPYKDFWYLFPDIDFRVPDPRRPRREDPDVISIHSGSDEQEPGDEDDHSSLSAGSETGKSSGHDDQSDNFKTFHSIENDNETDHLQASQLSEHEDDPGQSEARHSEGLASGEPNGFEAVYSDVHAEEPESRAEILQELSYHSKRYQALLAELVHYDVMEAARRGPGAYSSSQSHGSPSAVGVTEYQVHTEEPQSRAEILDDLYFHSKHYHEAWADLLHYDVMEAAEMGPGAYLFSQSQGWPSAVGVTQYQYPEGHSAQPLLPTIGHTYHRNQFDPYGAGYGRQQAPQSGPQDAAARRAEQSATPMQATRDSVYEAHLGTDFSSDSAVYLHGGSSSVRKPSSSLRGPIRPRARSSTLAGTVVSNESPSSRTLVPRTVPPHEVDGRQGVPQRWKGKGRAHEMAEDSTPLTPNVPYAEARSEHSGVSDISESSVESRKKSKSKDAHGMLDASASRPAATSERASKKSGSAKRRRRESGEISSLEHEHESSISSSLSSSEVPAKGTSKRPKLKSAPAVDPEEGSSQRPQPVVLVSSRSKAKESGKKRRGSKTMNDKEHKSEGEEGNDEEKEDNEEEGRKKKEKRERKKEKKRKENRE